MHWSVSRIIAIPVSMIVTDAVEGHGVIQKRELVGVGVNFWVFRLHDLEVPPAALKLVAFLAVLRNGGYVRREALALVAHHATRGPLLLTSCTSGALKRITAVDVAVPGSPM